MWFMPHEKPKALRSLRPHTRLVGCLFDQLQVELIAEGLLFQTLLYGQLYHRDAVVWIYLLETNAI